MQNNDTDRQRLLTLYFMTLPEHLGPEAFADLFAQDVESVLAQIQIDLGQATRSPRPYPMAKAA